MLDEKLAYIIVNGKKWGKRSRNWESGWSAQIFVPARYVYECMRPRIRPLHVSLSNFERGKMI